MVELVEAALHSVFVLRLPLPGGGALGRAARYSKIPRLAASPTADGRHLEERGARPLCLGPPAAALLDPVAREWWLPGSCTTSTVDQFHTLCVTAGLRGGYGLETFSTQVLAVKNETMLCRAML